MNFSLATVGSRKRLLAWVLQKIHMTDGSPCSAVAAFADQMIRGGEESSSTAGMRREGYRIQMEGGTGLDWSPDGVTRDQSVL